MRVSIQVGNRVYSELLNVEEERQKYIERCKDNDEPFNLNKFYSRYRDRECTGFDELYKDKSHFLFGWIECLGQSDYSPFPILEQFNDTSEEYIFRLDKINN